MFRQTRFVASVKSGYIICMKSKNILVCPLDWGIGHATRSIPIIRTLCDNGANVVIAADRRPYALLKREFPQLEIIGFPGYEVSYPLNGARMAFEMVMQTPRLIWTINREHQKLKSLIEQHMIDLVISDERFGLWTKKVPCVYLTHQVMVKFPPWMAFLEKVFYRMHRRWIELFTECWIPDLEGENNLTGDLAHKYPPPANAVYIGPLSRFMRTGGAAATYNDKNRELESELLILVSGPEPQRTVFEKLILEQVKDFTSMNILILLGRTDEQIEQQYTDNVKIFSHLPSDSLDVAMKQAGMIVSRPGYSTIMDLALLGKKAIFIPTPGQTEQEYLASKFMREEKFFCESQVRFDLKSALAKAKGFTGMHITTNSEKLIVERVENLIK